MEYEEINHCRKAQENGNCCGNCQSFLFERKIENVIGLSGRKTVLIGRCMMAAQKEDIIVKTTADTVCDIHSPQNRSDYPDQSIDELRYCGKLAMYRDGMCDRHYTPCAAKEGIQCTCVVSKWESPEHIKDRTGREPPNSAGCYVHFIGDGKGYRLMQYGAAQSYYDTVGRENMIIYFDNGNYGVPPENMIKED